MSFVSVKFTFINKVTINLSHTYDGFGAIQFLIAFHFGSYALWTYHHGNNGKEILSLWFLTAWLALPH